MTCLTDILMNTYLALTEINFKLHYFQVINHKGNINLKDVNIKPDKANEFLVWLSSPFALKAGMIGTLHAKVFSFSIVYYQYLLIL